jgi:hypothetical protein
MNPFKPKVPMSQEVKDEIKRRIIKKLQDKAINEAIKHYKKDK